MLIWAAATLGASPSANRGSPNVEIAVPAAELAYTRRPLGISSQSPRSIYYRPAGYERLMSVLEQAHITMPIEEALTTPIADREPLSLFHYRICAQSRWRGMIGDITSDYAVGVSMNDHQPAQSGDDDVALLRGHRVSDCGIRAAVRLEAEWGKVPTTN